MILTISPKTYCNDWVFFVLTDAAGQIFDVGINRFIELTNFSNNPIPDGDAPVFMHVIEIEADRLKLANHAVAYLDKDGLKKFKYKIQDIVVAWQKCAHKNGSPIMCVETGQVFTSAQACSNALNLTYSQLLNHLNGRTGFKTVKGRTYKRMGE